MGSVQQIRVKWNNHLTNFPKVFDNLLHKKDFVDVTLSCEGHTLKAHKLVLSACSPYFHTLFVENPCKHPIVIMRDFKYSEIEAVIEYMYKGEVNISRDSLRDFLRTAQSLQVKGLADDSCETDGADEDDRTTQNNQRNAPETETVPELPPPPNISRASNDQPAVNRDSYNQSNINREPREPYSHTPPKRMRISEKPVPVSHTTPRSPAESVPTQQQTVEVKAPQSPVEAAEELIEPSIKLEVKQYEELRYDETQDSTMDESQEGEQMGESPEPDTIVLGDDPDILDDDEPEVMFAHDSSSQDAMNPQDNLESTLMSALGNAGPSQGGGEGCFDPVIQHATAVRTYNRRRSNIIWEFFQEIAPGFRKVMCYSCGSTICRNTKKTKNGIIYHNTNLIGHLKSRHHNEYIRYMELTKPGSQQRRF